MIRKAEFDEGGGAIRVFVDFRRRSMFSCPACGKPAKACDTEELRKETSQLLPLCLLSGSVNPEDRLSRRRDTPD